MAILILWWWLVPTLIVGVAVSVYALAVHSHDKRLVPIYLECLFSIVFALTLLLSATGMLAWAASQKLSILNYTLVRTGGFRYVVELVRTSAEQCRDGQNTVDCCLVGSLVVTVVGAGLLAGALATGAGVVLFDLFNRVTKTWR